MANYHIIGGDGKEYGPVTDADVRQWIAEGRLNAQSLAKPGEDANFRPLATFPEFAGAFGDAFAGVPPTIEPLKPAGSAALAEGDYELDIGGCISRGWNLLATHFSTLFVGTLLYFLIELAFSLFSRIPAVGVIFSLGNFVISGPLLAGLLYLFIRANRGEPEEIGDLFAGFRRGFVQLFLCTLVQAILIGLCLVPFLIALFSRLTPLLEGVDPSTMEDPEEVLALLKSMLPALLGALPWLMVGMVPATFLGVCWKFSIPLIVDRQMSFDAAMKTSWRRVRKHWWQVFGLTLLIGLLNVVGALCCLVGVLFTVPIGYGALMAAYETIFSDRKN